MQLLYLLEKIRIPGLNECMLLITRLGEETAFLAIALVVFWCMDKRRGYFLMAVGFAGTILNQFLKLVFRVPRPWVLDPDFSILEAAREAATGYSFPSGHTQIAVGTFGALAVTEENRRNRILFVTLAALVGFSRMYIGVHTPYDVLASAAIALALVYGLRRRILFGGTTEMAVIITILLAMALGLMAFVEQWEFPSDVDPENLESGMKNAYSMLGCLAGVAVVYPLERKYVDFDTRACWWAQMLKVELGLAAVLAVKEGLRKPLEVVLGACNGRALRYMLIVVTAGLLWPMTFRWFSKLGGKK